MPCAFSRPLRLGHGFLRVYLLTDEAQIHAASTKGWFANVTVFLCMCMSEFPGADQLSENVTFVQGISNVNRSEGDPWWTRELLGIRIQLQSMSSQVWNVLNNDVRLINWIDLMGGWPQMKLKSKKLEKGRERRMRWTIQRQKQLSWVYIILGKDQIVTTNMRR